MQEIDFFQVKKDGKGFQFFGEFEIIVMGNVGVDLLVYVLCLLEGYGLYVLYEMVCYKQFVGGNYVLVMVSFCVQMWEEYDVVYIVLWVDLDICYMF